MASACPVPTQPMGLDTCVCCCGTPCFALTQVPASPKEVSLLGPAPSGCVPLEAIFNSLEDQHAARCTLEVDTPPTPVVKRG